MPVPDRPGGTARPGHRPARPPPHARAAAVHRLQRVAEALLEVAQRGVDVGVAVAPQPVRLAVRRVDDAGRLDPRGLHDLGLRHQPGLLGAPVGDEALVRRAPRRRLPLGLGARPLGEVGVLPAALGHRPLGLVPGLGDGLLGLGARGRDQPLRLGPGLGDQLLGILGGAGPGVLGLLLGLGDDLVAAVEHVLGVVQLARERLADVVEQLEDVAARHDAVRGHRQTAGLLDQRDERVQRLEDPVHAPHPRTGHRPDGGLHPSACPDPRLRRARGSARSCAGAPAPAAGGRRRRRTWRPP